MRYSLEVQYLSLSVQNLHSLQKMQNHFFSGMVILPGPAAKHPYSHSLTHSLHTRVGQKKRKNRSEKTHELMLKIY